MTKIVLTIAFFWLLKTMKDTLDPDDIVKQILSGNKRMTARAITYIENNDAFGQKILQKLYPFTGSSFIIGITGAPGSGKSTLINELAKTFKKEGIKIAIISVDPSSPFTGGSVLGDRIRMTDLFLDEKIFIRSMATRGHLGGLARTTLDVFKTLDVYGQEDSTYVSRNGVVIVETVGSGQSEVEIAESADCIVVVLIPGMGDDIQTIKAGILEIADIFVINKADLTNVDFVEYNVRTLLGMNKMDQEDLDQVWTPPIIKTIAKTGENIDVLHESINQFKRWSIEHKSLEQRKLNNIRTELVNRVRDQLVEMISEKLVSNNFDGVVANVYNHVIDPIAAADEIIEQFLKENIKTTQKPD